jgi:hypothetical protein
MDAVVAAPAATAVPTWSTVEALHSARQSERIADIDRLLDSVGDHCLDHEPRWLHTLAAEPGKRTLLWTCMQGDRLIAYAPMLVHPSSLSLEVMGKTLYQMRVERFSLTGAPVFAPGVDQPALSQALLAALARELGDGKVGFILGLPSASALYTAIAAPRRDFHVLKSGPEYGRRVIELGNTYDAYLQELGSKTRKSLRYQETQLRKNTKSFTVRGFAAVAEVPEFLHGAQQISQKTYQWHLLGQGVRDNEPMRKRLLDAASHGWFRSYVLYCDDVPAAFMLGYLYKGNYECVEIGYDPAWAKFSVGNILHLEVVRDLTSPAVGARFFDFMYGDSPNKARLTNRTWPERNYYLIPRTLRMTAWTNLARGFNATTEGVGKILDRYDLKTKLRRLVRRSSVRDVEAAEDKSDGKKS